MATIQNNTGKHWEFGSMKVPPGASVWTDAEIAAARASTAIDRYMMDAADLRAPGADFTLDMHVDAPITHRCECGAPLSAKAVACPDCSVQSIEEATKAAKAKLAGHTAKQLRGMAKEQGVTGYSKMDRDELILALEAE